jgi:hypothetical protein
MNDAQDPEAPQDDFYEETLQDHKECMAVVSEVEACLDRQPDREGQWIAELVAKLEHLAQTMREHFKEENDGLYVQLPIKFPRLANRLAKLKGEHGQMLQTIEKTTAMAQRLNEPEMHELRELNAHVQLLVATIRRHEAEENELVIEAHWDEVGVGD